MFTELPPELVKRIIEHCLDEGNTLGRVNKDVVNSNQRRLVRLSLVCKTLAEHCLPLLYNDAILSHPTAILNHGARLPLNYAQTKRLRLSHQPPEISDLYGLLICDIWGKWSMVHLKQSPRSPDRQELMAALDEARLWGHVASRLFEQLYEQLEDEGGRAGAFTQLERVVMGDFEEWWWYRRYQELREDHVIKLSETTHESLAQYLVQLETVQHYCQSELFGPVALPCLLLRMPTPPKIVTYHMPCDFFGDFADDESLHPPVVRGAINRFFFPLPVPSFFLPDENRDQVKQREEELLSRLFDMMRQDDQLTWRGCVEPGRVDRSDTVIEVYHYVERIAVDSRDEATRLGLSWPPQDPSSPLTRLPLNPLQTWLDNRRQPELPRLYLKTLDEAEPCTACDFDFQAAGYKSPQRAVAAIDSTFRFYI